MSIDIFANLNLMLKKAYILLFLVLYTKTSAQYSYTELGVSAGPVFFKSDYGARNDFENFVKNNGYSIGINYYTTPNNFYGGFWEHIKLRFDLTYMKADLKHYGEWVAPERTNNFANQLRGMYGSTETINFGTQFEYYPLRTDDYNRGEMFNPYFGIGPQINYVSTKAESTLGKLGSPITTPEKYMGAYKNESFWVPSVCASVGVRYKLSDYHALTAEVRGQFYFSDWVDGLNPDRKVYTENKANDYNLGFSIGYVYYFSNVRFY